MHARNQQQQTKKKSELSLNNKILMSIIIYLLICLVDGVTEVTRSARKYCKTGATLGQGGTQAYLTPSRGLNNPLKLL